MRSDGVKERVAKDMQRRMQGNADLIDMDPTVTYSRNPQETLEYRQFIENQEEDEKMDLEEEAKEEAEVAKEYIFLIDRSGSMYHTITLARKALILFLHSLPEGSRFNICSYGSNFKFLFEGVRSVEYNDENLQFAQAQVAEFDANFGGTEIYSPLKTIFDFGAP